MLSGVMHATDRSEGPHGRLKEPPSHSWSRSVRGYLLLPHLGPVLVVEAATAAFATIAWGGLPPTRLLLPLLLAMLGGQLVIGATNELVDLPFDTKGQPWKPLPSGDVSIRGARTMVVGGLVLMVAFGATFGLTAFALLTMGTGLGLAYDLWLKRTAWSWLAYLLALPLLPIWVFTALGRPEPRLALLYPLGALAAVGVHFAQALPDVTIDREAGFRTATSRLGGPPTFLAAWLMIFTAPALAWIAATQFGGARSTDLIEIAAGIGVALLVGNLVLLAVDQQLGVRACFPLVALATLCNGLAWTMSVTH